MSSQRIVAIILIIAGAVLVLWVLLMWMVPSMMGNMMGGMMGSMSGCMGMCTFGPLLLAAVVLADFNIRRPLALNQPVVITFTPTKSGSFTFVCGMNMLRGELIVQ